MTVLQQLMRFPTKIAYLVSSQGKVDQRSREYILPRSRRIELAEAACQIANRGLALCMLSELSMGMRGERFSINAENLWFPAAHEEDFTIASLNHDHLILSKPQPAAHTLWHRRIYQSTQAGAVLLCQPRSALQCSFAPVSLDANLLPDASRAVKNIVWASPEVDEIVHAAGSSQVILVKGIGLLVWADTIQEAAALAETTEVFLWAHCTVGNK
jgi:ribulose-5-phosphate 4-epimerase/fuculose-1-phosphate aldolase